MLNSNQVPIEQSALLVIDVQDSFKVLPRWPRRNNPGFEKNVTKMIDLYREAGLPVIYFLHWDDDPGFERDNPNKKLMDFIKNRPEEPIIEKGTRNAFTSTDLSSLLLKLGVRRLAIIGIQTEQCCETTARVAGDLGYAVDFVTEATLTFPIANLDNPAEELGTDEVVERTEYALRGRFATIKTVAQLEKELKGVQRFAHAG
ncbi:MAG TPA: isochorismatase family protein [Terriglobales bacterium]|nr:isochorismatase family protein [Terriglobales bacterium]